MKYTGLTYRPPFEAGSLLLQVTQGCSHNSCAFCTMYRDVPFKTETMEQIETDLKEASRYSWKPDRVFLENGDAFALSAEKLITIAEMIHKYLPYVDTIAMYASINNIKNKTDKDLAELRKLGINDLNIGVESGLDDALTHLNKGYTAKEAEYELLRLREAGIDYGANVILGAAGPGKRFENAEATAELLNKTKPYLIFTGTLHADRGCPLYDELAEGSFTENTIGEYLEEEERLISRLDLEGCFLFGLHPSNVVTMRGYLNRDRERFLSMIEKRRQELKNRLTECPLHYGEGAIV